MTCLEAEKSGLVEAEEILKHVRDIDFCYLKDVDVVRHELVKKIINAYDSFYKQHPEEIQGVNSEVNPAEYRRREIQRTEVQAQKKKNLS